MKIDNVNIPRKLKVKKFLTSREKEVFRAKDLSNEFNTSASRMYGTLKNLSDDPKTDIEMFSLSNSTYFGTSKSINKLSNRVDNNIKSMKEQKEV